jgi:hypothetical protein
MYLRKVALCMNLILLGNNHFKIQKLNEDLNGLQKRMLSAEMQLVNNQILLEEMEARIELIENQLDHSTDLQIQSSEEMMATSSGSGIDATHDEHEVVEFAEGIEDNQAGESSVLDPIHTGLAESYALNEFMSRPTLIHSYTIPQGESFSNSRMFNPWLDYFSSTRIKKKLDNYAYIRCDLKLKFVVNSSPFIYGNYCAAYQPLQEFNQDLRPSTPMGYNERLMLSQRPNVMIESHKNKGGELTCPFFYHKDWLPLTNDDLEEMGEITLFQYAQFRAANTTATGDVTINVYAWAENVCLTGATVLTVQTGDEYGEGPVQRTATAVASVSRAIEEIPVIGVFAKATTFAADAVGAIAGLFGFTNVPVIEDVKPFKDQPYHAFASAQIGVPIEKLTLDPKNELTIDPGISGLNADDEMAISYLVQRESLLDTSTWTQSAVKDDNVFQIVVNPTSCARNSGAVFYTALETPVGHVSRMFGNWRGSLVYTIKIIASPYHQGRLRVSYDPRGDVFAEDDTDNVVVTKIIDLSITDEAEFVIPYMQPQAWQEVDQYYPPRIFTHDNTYGFSPPYDDTVCNGRMRVSVLNPLTGPDSTSDVDVLLFIRGGPDYELANPGAMPNRWTPLEVQTADEIVSADGKVSYTMGEMTSRPVDANLVHFGEAIRSVRPVLRRTNFLTHRYTASYGGTGTNYRAHMSGNIYPQHYGYLPRSFYRGPGLIDDTTDYDISLASVHPITWMAMCYAGIRGSMHYHYNQQDGVDFPDVVATRVLGPASKSYSISEDAIDEANAEPYSTTINSGAMLQNEKTQNGVSFTVPFMNKYKFTPCGSNYLGIGNSTKYQLVENNYLVQYRIRQQDLPVNYQTQARVYAGAGTDFTLLNFIGVPPKYAYDAVADDLSLGIL